MMKKGTNHLARISHEHCVNFENSCRIQIMSQLSVIEQIYTMFTKGQPRRRHLLQYFNSKYRSLLFTVENFEADAA